MGTLPLNKIFWDFYLDKRHRLPTLFELAENGHITEGEFWKYLPSIWTDSEQTEKPENLERFYALIHYYGLSARPKELQPPKNKKANPTMRKGFIECYRAGDYHETDQPSWSLSTDVAMKFLYMYPVANPTIYIGNVARSDVIFYTNDRREQELVVQRGSVEIISKSKHKWTDERFSIAQMKQNCQDGLFDTATSFALRANNEEMKRKLITVCEEAIAQLTEWKITTPLPWWQERLCAVQGFDPVLFYGNTGFRFGAMDPNHPWFKFGVPVEDKG